MVRGPFPECLAGPRIRLHITGTSTNKRRGIGEAKRQSGVTLRPRCDVQRRSVPVPIYRGNAPDSGRDKVRSDGEAIPAAVEVPIYRDGSLGDNWRRVAALRMRFS